MGYWDEPPSSRQRVMMAGVGAAALAGFAYAIVFSSTGGFNGISDFVFHLAKAQGMHGTLLGLSLDNYAPLWGWLTNAADYILPFGAAFAMVALSMLVLYFTIPLLVHEIAGELAAYLYLFATGVPWLIMQMATFPQALVIVWMLGYIKYPKLFLLWFGLAALSHKYGAVLIAGIFFVEFIMERYERWLLKRSNASS